MLKSQKNTYHFLLSLLTFFLLTYLVFSYYSIGNRVWIFYNSDNIYIPYLYQDLVLRGGSILKWKFSPVPYLFPDFILYSIGAILTQNLKVAILVFATAQLFLFYWLVVLIGKKITQDSTLFHLSVFVSLLLLASGGLQQETLQYALVSQEHFGTALMFLLGLYLIIRTFQSPSKWNYIFLFLICFLTTFSDIVFITQFFATAMASLCLMMFFSEKDSRKIFRNNLFVILSGTLLSYLLYRLRAFSLHITINPHLVRRSQLSELIAATTQIRQNFADFYQHNTIVVLLLVMFFIVSLLFLIQSFFMRKKTDMNFTFAVLFLFMAMIMGYFSLLFADNDLMDAGYNGMRHYQPYVLFPVFLGIPLYLSQYTNLGALVSKYYGSIILAILLCAFLFSPKGSVANIINFYPSSVACLDQYADQYHLQSGVANYWEAKSYSFLSKKKLNIVAIENNRKTQVLQPELWINTLNDYTGKQFNFLLIESDHNESADEQYVQKAFGKPQTVLQCPAWEDGRKDKIYIYQNGAIDKWMAEELKHPAYF